MFKFSIWMILLLSSAVWAEKQTSTEAVNLVFVANISDTIAPDELDLKAIIKGDQGNWSNGDSIRLVLPGRDAEIYEHVGRRVFGESGMMMQKRWLKLVFSGRRNPPKYADSEKEMIDFVLNTPGSAAVIRAQVDQNLAQLLVKAI